MVEIKLLHNDNDTILICDFGSEASWIQLRDQEKSMHRCPNCLYYYTKPSVQKVDIVINFKDKIVAQADIYWYFTHLEDWTKFQQILCPVCFLGTDLNQMQEIDLEENKTELQKIIEQDPNFRNNNRKNVDKKKD